MEKKLFNLEEIEKLAEKRHDGLIIKKLKINSDSKNFFVRIPKEIADFIKIQNGDRMIMTLDTKQKEAIIQCQLTKT